MVKLLNGSFSSNLDDTPTQTVNGGVFLTKNSLISASGLNAPGLLLTSFGGSQIHGQVFSSHAAAIQVQSHLTDIMVGETGVLGGFVGIQFDTGGRLVNFGQIITQAISINFLGGSNIQLENYGVIACDIINDAVQVRSGGENSLFNAGTISGSIRGEVGNETLTNQGLIAGKIRLGDGNDSYSGELGRVTGFIDMGRGIDAATGGSSSETFKANDADGDDDYDGGGGSDTYDARDVTSGIVADLTLGSIQMAGGGSDSSVSIENILGGRANDRLAGNAAANRLRGEDGNDVINGLGGNDRLDGGFGRNIILGGTGNDRIKGGEARDTLKGDGGDDFIYGGNDIDVMTGGTGSDTFDFNDQDETYLVTDGAPDRDRITDFAPGEDRIDFSTIDAKPEIFGNQEFAFIGTAAFSDTGQVRYRQVGSQTLVQVSIVTPDGASIEIELTGLKTLEATDFIL